MELRAEMISAALSPGSLFAGKIAVEPSVDSTNSQLKNMAAGGAPEGTVLLAEEQIGGRGTRGRSFFSPRGEGLYLSALLRPSAPLSDLAGLTAWVAVAVRRGVEKACGAPAKIKWLNDLYLNGKKLCGVLTELVLNGVGEPDCVVIGIGVNVSQSEETFRAQGLEGIATSLAAEGYEVSRCELCLHILHELEEMYRAFPHEHPLWLEEYRRFCVTPGRAVTFEENGATLRGEAVAVAEDFTLTVRGENGRERSVFAGTVSHL